MPDRAHSSRYDAALVAVAAELLADVQAFSEGIAGRILASIEFYRQFPLEELRQSCRGNAEFVLRSFIDDEQADVAAAQATGERRAEQGVPLPIVMAAFRVGFREIWNVLVQRSRQTNAVSPDALVDAASDIWAAHDMFSEAMATSYREAFMADAIRTERERSALVAALLEGRLMEQMTVWDVADVLRLSNRGPFVVVAAEAARVAQEALRNAEAQLRAKGIGSAWRLLPDLQVGIVRLRQADQVPVLAGVLDSIALGRVGVSPPYGPLNETAQALRFARIALATGPEGSRRVTVFDDFPLAVAAISAPDSMSRVAVTVLGPILSLPPSDRAILLETLAAWRDNGGSATATAKRIFCHPNTVRHRLTRIEDHTGRSLADPKDAAELLLALEASSLLPPAEE